MWCRGGGVAAQIDKIEYTLNPRLRRSFDEKRAEYDRRFGKTKHDCIWGFHGTKSENVPLILNDGFKISKVGSTTDAGFFGKVHTRTRASMHARTDAHARTHTRMLGGRESTSRSTSRCLLVI